MRNGCSMTTTLLAKDTAHKTAFPVFTPGGGFGMAEMEGGGDFLMIADPTTFRVLPWAPHTGWVLCDIYFANGKPVPFSTRHLYRRALQKLAEAGFDYMAGLEVEFHVFKLDDAAAQAVGRHLAGRAARGQPALPGLPVSDRDTARPDGADPRNGAPRYHRARPAAALGRDRARPEPMRVHLPPAGRTFAGRYHDAVPQRGEADLPAAGLSRQLHGAAEGGERAVERLAPAPVAARSALRHQRVHVPRQGTAVAQQGAASSPASFPMRAPRPPSPRRRSTATSAIAATRWRRTAPSGDATIAA